MAKGARFSYLVDQFVGFEGKRLPDTVNFPGRGKVIWEPNADTKITFEPGFCVRTHVGTIHGA